MTEENADSLVEQVIAGISPPLKGLILGDIWTPQRAEITLSDGRLLLVHLGVYSPR